MSYYRLGVRPAFQKQRLVIGDGGIAGTGILADVQTELNEIDAEMKSLNTELFNQMPADLNDPKARFYLGAWRPFAEEFQDFRDNRSATTIANIARSMSPFLGRAMWKDLQDYRARLVAQFDAARKAGFRILGAAPTKPKKSTFEDAGDALSGILQFLKMLAYIAIGLGVGWLALQVFREVRR